MGTEKNEDVRAKKAIFVTWVGSIGNFILIIFKLLAGIWGNSSAMIADAVHSISDFITDVVVIFSFRIVNKPPDHDHEYGHGKFETLATTLISFFLFLAGGGIFYSGAKKIWVFCFHGGILEKPGKIALVAALISILIKEILYQVTKKTGEKINSKAIIANAWHHRSDALSSVGSFIGIAMAVFLGNKWLIMDPLAAIVVSIFIFKVAFEISLDSIGELLEASLEEESKIEIIEIINSVDGAYEPHSLRTRKVGNNIAFEAHIYVDRHLNIVEAHDISVKIEDKIKGRFGEKTFISIHVEPKPISGKDIIK